LAIVLFRCDYSQSVGGGHLSRCKALARKLPPECKPLFVVRGNQNFLQAKLPGELDSFLIVPEEVSFGLELSLIDSAISWEEVTSTFLDFTNSSTFSMISELPEYLRQISERCPTSVLIDSMDEDSLIYRSRELKVKFLVTPYAGATKESGPFQHIFGPEYFVLSLNFNLPIDPLPSIAPVANKILVSMGQSDPTGMSSRVLRALLGKSQWAEGIALRLILGPLFSKQLSDEINSVSKNAGFPIELISSPQDMAEHYRWSDMTIASTGLTKYELAVLGVPALLLSPNAVMEKLQKKYDALGVSVHLGDESKLDVTSLAHSIFSFRNDLPLRTKLATKGMSLIDGRGAERLLNLVFDRRKLERAESK